MVSRQQLPDTQAFEASVVGKLHNAILLHVSQMRSVLRQGRNKERLGSNELDSYALHVNSDNLNTFKCHTPNPSNHMTLLMTTHVTLENGRKCISFAPMEESQKMHAEVLVYACSGLGWFGPSKQPTRLMLRASLVNMMMHVLMIVGVGRLHCDCVLLVCHHGFIISSSLMASTTNS